jgi:hypothetical protein
MRRSFKMPNPFKIELQLLLRRIGLSRPVVWRTLVLHLIVLAAFGVVLPWAKGVEFMDPALPTIYACLGALFGAPALVQMLREGNPAWPDVEWEATAAKIAVATVYGEATSLAILVLGIVTVLALHPQAYLFLPDPILLGEAMLLGLASTLALTALAAWITLQFSARVATSVLRLLFLFLFALFLLRSWWLPGIAGLGALVAFVCAGCLLLLLKRRMAK